MTIRKLKILATSHPNQLLRNHFVYSAIPNFNRNVGRGKKIKKEYVLQKKNQRPHFSTPFFPHTLLMFKSPVVSKMFQMLLFIYFLLFILFQLRKTFYTISSGIPVERSNADRGRNFFPYIPNSSLK